MAVDAVAMNSLSAEVFRDVLKNGAKVVRDTGCAIVPEAYLKIVDEYTDWKMEREAAARLANPDPVLHTEAEALARLGITLADMDAAEDIGIE